MGRFWAAVLCGVVVTGCRAGGFACESDEQCVQGGDPGYCEAGGQCSFDDPECASGRRFGGLASGVADSCVPVDDASTGSMTSGGSTTVTATATTTGSIGTDGSTGPTCEPEFFPDADMDGFGDPTGAPACTAGPGTSDNDLDCDDTDPRVKPAGLACPLDPALVGWWRLDETSGSTFADSSAAGNDGNAGASAPELGQPGAYGSAGLFGDDEIDIDGAANALAPMGNPPGQGTFEAWLWADANIGGGMCGFSGCGRVALWVGEQGSDGFGNDDGAHIHVVSGGAMGPPRWGGRVGPGFGGCQLASDPLTTETWTHVALTWSDSGCQLYVDGAQVDTDGLSFLGGSWTRARIGAPDTGFARDFQGAIDEAMIWTTARTVDEIRSDCGPPCQN